jgi:hypothetical protein
MRQLTQLLTTAALTTCFLLLLVQQDRLNDRGQTFNPAEDDSNDSDEHDSFAAQRKHLDKVCEKYRDVLRPEYLNFYSQDYLLHNLSTSYFIAAERQFSGRSIKLLYCIFLLLSVI